MYVCVCVCRWTHAFLDSVSKVEGSISGKSFRKTGRRNSMKGTMMNTVKGTRRKRSAQVRNSWETKVADKVSRRWVGGGDTSAGDTSIAGTPLSVHL